MFMTIKLGAFRVNIN